MTVVPRIVAALWLAAVLTAAPAFAIDVRKIDGSVDAGPASVAWSPDNQLVAALMSGQIKLIGTTEDTAATLPLKGVRAISWAPSADLLVVRTTASGSVVERVNPDTGKATSLNVQGSPIGCRWLTTDKALVSISEVNRVMTIGTVVKAPLVVVAGGEATPVYTLDTLLPTRAPGIDYLSGWTTSGAHPAIGDLLVPEFHNPPAFEPFLLFKMVDPAGGPALDLFRVTGHRFTASASWSPEGTRLAVSDDQGRLHVWSAGNDDPRLIDPAAARGQWPSWNPAADLIHVGGQVVTPAGQLVHDIAANAVEAIGTWSPDGRSLLIASKDGLILATGFEIPPADPASANSDVSSKMETLRRLLNRGLIEQNDYNERKLKLLKTIGLMQ